MKEFVIFNRPFEFLTEERQWIKLRGFLNQYLFDNAWGKYAILLLVIIGIGFLASIFLHGILKKVMNHVLLFEYIGVLIILFVVSRNAARGFRVFNVSDYLTESGFHETRVLISLINCLMFVPFGILLRKVSGKSHAITNVLLILIAAVGIEVAQYAFFKGYSAAEDVLMYVIGGFAGLILATPFCLISQYLENRREEERQERLDARRWISR